MSSPIISTTSNVDISSMTDREYIAHLEQKIELLEKIEREKKWCNIHHQSLYNDDGLKCSGCLEEEEEDNSRMAYCAEDDCDNELEYTIKEVIRGAPDNCADCYLEILKAFEVKTANMVRDRRVEEAKKTGKKTILKVLKVVKKDAIKEAEKEEEKVEGCSYCDTIKLMDSMERENIDPEPVIYKGEWMCFWCYDEADKEEERCAWCKSSMDEPRGKIQSCDENICSEDCYREFYKEEAEEEPNECENCGGRSFKYSTELCERLGEGYYCGTCEKEAVEEDEEEEEAKCEECGASANSEDCDCVFCCVCGEVNMTLLKDNIKDTCDDCIKEEEEEEEEKMTERGYERDENGEWKRLLDTEEKVEKYCYDLIMGAN
jgi:DNA-directed RNA polymerase subunit RPC12/RpoP